MSTKNISAVSRFLKLIEPSELTPVSHDILSDQVRYDVLIAQMNPVQCSLHGRREVADYLAILRATYLVQKDAERVLVEAEDKVVVVGSEHAFLVRLRQVVKAEWTAIFELSDGQINSISMMVYRWTVLEASAQLPFLPPRCDQGIAGGHILPTPVSQLPAVSGPLGWV